MVISLPCFQCLQKKKKSKIHVNEKYFKVYFRYYIRYFFCRCSPGWGSVKWYSVDKKSPSPRFSAHNQLLKQQSLLSIMSLIMEYMCASSCPTLRDPMDHSPPGSFVHGILQARILEWAATSPPGDLPNPGVKPRSPALQVDSLPSEPPGKPKNAEVGSLSLLQGIFLI